MQRPHLFEWMDQPWLPTLLRDEITDQLRAAEDLFRPFHAVEPLLSALVAKTGVPHFIDLCSGGGGPVPQLLSRLREGGVVEGAVLTDRFPNLPAFEATAAAHPGVTFHPDPVDATRVPEGLRGVRTIFNSFHHFPPTLARAILADAARSRQPILIVEALSRTAVGVGAGVGVALLGPVLALPRLPRLMPLALNTVFPLMPLLMTWEGAVSALRCYAPDELQELTDGLGGADYRWTIEHLPTGWPLLTLTCLRGEPLG